METKDEVAVVRADRERQDSDNGCDLHSTCATCPLPLCRYDMRLEWQLSKIRDATIVSLYFEYGYTQRQIRDITPEMPKSSIMNVIRGERKRRENGWEEHDVHEMYRVKVEVKNA